MKTPDNAPNIKVGHKTPDEIKKGLECCYGNEERRFCEMCPFGVKTDGIYPAFICSNFDAVGEGALALIQQLQAENTKKDETIQMLQDGNASLMRMIDEECEKTVTLEAERDAAVCDITEIVQNSGDSYCEYCKNWKPGTCPTYCRTHNEGFRWRGVQKEATP